MVGGTSRQRREQHQAHNLSNSGPLAYCEVAPGTSIARGPSRTHREARDKVLKPTEKNAIATHAPNPVQRNRECPFVRRITTAHKLLHPSRRLPYEDYAFVFRIMRLQQGFTMGGKGAWRSFCVAAMQSTDVAMDHERRIGTVCAMSASHPIVFSNSGSGCQAFHDHPCRAHCSLRGRGVPSA